MNNSELNRETLRQLVIDTFRAADFRRATFGGTYRPIDNWSFTMVGRYQSKIYSTLDNTDNVAHVYQTFDPYLVFDMRLQYQLNERGSLAFGIDNVFNQQDFLFHPFPQRTYVMQGRLKF